MDGNNELNETNAAVSAAGQVETSPALPDVSGMVAGPEKSAEGREEAPDICKLPDIKVSGCFSSHMVLQRDQDVKVFGFSRHPGLKVRGVWKGRETSEAEAVVNEEGRFTLVFPPRKADREPSSMIIESAYGSFVMSDILVGDVWLIGGQSNAECCLAHCIRTTPELVNDISAADNFRLFRQSQAVAYEFREDCAYPKLDIIDPSWRWKRPDPAAAYEFSAMGYYFAKELVRHTDVPIGLMMLCPGGACLRELMPEWLAVERGYTFGANMPVGGYYNTLISPLVGISFYGQLFFQGESEGGWKDMAYNYDADLKALVDDERETFGRDFPFYNVQLSSYREEGKSYFPYLHIVRVKQFDALSIIPDSHLAVDMDLGAAPEDSDFAHSPYKSELGRRLAMQVWAYEYGGRASMPDPGEYESPVPQFVERVNGGFEITFANSGKGLRALSGKAPSGFGIIFEGDEEPEDAISEITGPDKVLIKPDKEKAAGRKAAAVTYAQFHIADKAHADLVNSFGLPAPAWSMPVTD